MTCSSEILADCKRLCENYICYDCQSMHTLRILPTHMVRLHEKVANRADVNSSGFLRDPASKLL